MKFIRLLLTSLLLVVALAGLLLAAAFSPIVQTWFAQRTLARHPEWHATLGSLAAGLSTAEIADLRLEGGGAVLTVPSLRCGLPLVTVARQRRAPIQSLVAKGWTLDLSRAPAPPDARAMATAGSRGGAEASGAAGPERTVARLFSGLLSGWTLPCDFSLEGVELEGDVLIAVPQGAAPTRVHVVIKGGGLAPGRDGIFVVDASVLDLRWPGESLAAKGELRVGMKGARSIERLEFKGHLSAENLPKAGDLAWDLDVAAERGPAGEIYRLNLGRGARHLAKVAAQWRPGADRFAGTWQVDLRAADLAPFMPELAQPVAWMEGQGRFETETNFAHKRVVGRLTTAGSHWNVVAPWLDGIGEATLAVRFDLTRTGRSIHIDEGTVALAGTQPIAELRALQPFEFDEGTGTITLSNPQGDWVAAAIRGLPLAWVSGMTKGLAVAGGDATGDFVIRYADGNLTLRPRTPLAVTGVSVKREGWALGRGMDLSLSISADYAPATGAWKAELTPLTLASGAQGVAKLEAKASRPAGEGQAIAFSGTWNADLAALQSQVASPGLPWLTARSASGEFSGTVGSYADVLSKLAVIGHDSSHRLDAKARAYLYADGTAAIVVPIKMVFGKEMSDVTADVNWPGSGRARGLELTLRSENVAWEHLRLLAAPWMAGGWGGAASAAATRDQVPFWGDWEGHVTMAVDRLRTAGMELVDLGGSLKIELGSIRLAGGHGGMGQRHWSEVNGTITFDPAATFPYTANATVPTDEVEGESFFSPPPEDKEPVFKGRITIAYALTSKGMNLTDLLARRQEEVRLTSSSGIIRLLRTYAAQALPPPPTSRVGDALIDVGSAVAKLFGSKSKSVVSGEVTVSKTTEAVLDFDLAMAEIGYDNLAITAVRGADGTLHLGEVTMVSPDVHLTGSGEISELKGAGLAARPLSADLEFGAKGRIAELLGKAGLLSDKKDALGYTLLPQPIHFSGTLEHLKQDAWRDVLVETAAGKRVR